MKTACDMFGPHDVTTLADVVRHVEEYDEECWLYVMPVRPLQPETPALVVDEGSSRDLRAAEELGLVEHHEMFLIREVIDCARNREADDDESSIRALVRAIDSL
jgi:hypothetical protein